MIIPVKPVAYNHGRVSMNYGLLYGIMAFILGYLGVQVYHIRILLDVCVLFPAPNQEEAKAQHPPTAL